MTVTTTLASPARIAALARPMAPAEPPPPEVRAALKVTSGIPSVSMNSAVSITSP